MAKNSRMNSWTLMKILVVPCLFLCAIFKHPAFQWIACVALAIWVCFMLADVIRPRLKKQEKAATPTARGTEKDAMPAPENAETDETRLSLLRQVNHRIMEQLKQSYPMGLLALVGTASDNRGNQQRLYPKDQALQLRSFQFRGSHHRAIRQA